MTGSGLIGSWPRIAIESADDRRKMATASVGSHMELGRGEAPASPLGVVNGDPCLRPTGPRESRNWQPPPPERAPPGGRFNMPGCRCYRRRQWANHERRVPFGGTWAIDTAWRSNPWSADLLPSSLLAFLSIEPVDPVPSRTCLRTPIPLDTHSAY